MESVSSASLASAIVSLGPHRDRDIAEVEQVEAHHQQLVDRLGEPAVGEDVLRKTRPLRDSVVATQTVSPTLTAR